MTRPYPCSLWRIPRIRTRLLKIRNDAIIKYVMGQLDDDGIKAVQKDWLNAGGAKALEEFNAEYAKAAGK